MTMESEKEPNLHVGKNETCGKNHLFFLRNTKNEKYFLKQADTSSLKIIKLTGSV